MSLLDKNAAILARSMGQILYTDYANGVTGRYASGGALDPDPDADLTDGYIWVRLGSNRSAEACLNSVVARAVGIPVVTAYNKKSKQREVIGVDTATAVTLYTGDEVAIMGTPTAGTSASMVRARQFEPGLVAPDTSRGGLYVLIQPFWTKGVYVQEYSLLLTPTATSGKTSYACVYYDSGSFGQVLSTDRDTALFTDLDDVVAANPNRIWLAAVPLANGATTASPAGIVDLRQWLSQNVGSTSTRTVTATDDIDDTTDYVFINADASGGAITLTLPAVADAARRTIHVTKVDSSAYTVTVDGSGAETINGDTTLVIQYQWSSASLFCTGTEWVIT